MASSKAISHLLFMGLAIAMCLHAAKGQDLLGLLKGTELVKNGNSLFKTGRAYNKAACGVLCGKLPGCNGWSYCDSKTGCGSGCPAYVQKNGKLAKDAAAGYGAAYMGLALPVKKVGYWTYPKEGGSGCQGDKWAYGTCTLFQLPDPKKPTLAVKGSGWLSRPILPVPGCTKGLPWTCLNCNDPKVAGANKAQCLACANANPIPTKQPLSGMLAYTNTAQGACLKCGQQAKGTPANNCFTCVTKKKPCASCAYTAPGKPEADVAGCISCAFDDTPKSPDIGGPLTPTRTSVCNECARGPVKQRDSCLKCLRGISPPVCKGNQLGDEQGICTYPSPAIQSCKSCISSPQCQACSAKKGAACLQCSSYTGEAGKDCYQCVADGKNACSRCVVDQTDFSADPGSGATIKVLDGSCLACYNDKTMRDPDVCYQCSRDGPLLGVDIVKCEKCVQDPKQDINTCMQSPL